MTEHFNTTSPLAEPIRQAVDAIVAEFDVPLPQGDARIIEAADVCQR